MKTKKNRLFILPNVISLLRILLIPIFIVMMLQRKTLEAFAVFLLAGLTDLLDGFTARLWHLKTRIGALLDPAADKLLMTASFIVLTIPSINSPHIIPLWLTIVVISRDLVIVSSAFVLYKLRGQKTFRPSLLGKASTVCQIMVVLLVLFFNSFQISSPYLSLLCLLTLALTLLSGFHYFYIGIRLISFPKRI